FADWSTTLTVKSPSLWWLCAPAVSVAAAVSIAPAVPVAAAVSVAPAGPTVVDGRSCGRLGPDLQRGCRQFGCHRLRRRPERGPVARLLLHLQRRLEPSRLFVLCRRNGDSYRRLH